MKCANNSRSSILRVLSFFFLEIFCNGNGSHEQYKNISTKDDRAYYDVPSLVAILEI